MKYCIEDNYNDLLNLFFDMQRKQAAGTVYILLDNQLNIIDTELIACGENIIQIKFKVSKSSKKNADNFEEYNCILLKSDFGNGIFKINIKNEDNIDVELEIIKLLTKIMYNYNTINSTKGF